MLTPRIFGNSVVVTTTNANGSVPLSPSTILTIPAACGGLGQVSSIAFSPRGDLVAAASAAKGVLVWSLNSMTLVKTLTAPFGAIATAIAFNLDGSEIAIGTNGGGIALHNVDNGEVEEFYTDAEGCTAITFSEDSHWIGICSKSQVCYFDQNNDNPNVRSLLVDGYEHQIGELSSLQFSRDGEFVAACTTDGQHVLQWSTASGELLRSSITPMVPLTNASRVCGVREWRGMPDALSSIHENGLVYCWCYEGTANVRSVNDDSLLMTAAFVGPATCVAMSPDMNWVAVGTASNGIAVCPLPTAHHVARRVTAAALVMGSPPLQSFLATATVSAAHTNEVSLWPLALQSPTSTLICTRIASIPFECSQLATLRHGGLVHVMCVGEPGVTTVTFDIAENSLPTYQFEDVTKRGDPLLIHGGGQWTLHIADYRRDDSLLFWEYKKDFKSAELSARALSKIGKHPQLINAKAIVRDIHGRVRGIAAEYDTSIVQNIREATCQSQLGYSPIYHLRRLYEYAVVLRHVHSRNCVHDQLDRHSFVEIASTTLLVGFEGALMPGDVLANTSRDVLAFGRLMKDKLQDLDARHNPFGGLKNDLVALRDRCLSEDASYRPSMDLIARSLEPMLTAKLAEKDLSDDLYNSNGLIRTEGSEDLCRVLKKLQWQFQHNLLIAMLPSDVNHPCQKFVRSLLSRDKNFDQSRIDRILMIGSSGETANAFMTLHKHENEGRQSNLNLSVNVDTDEDSQSAVRKLKNSFVDGGGPDPTTLRARIVLGWYGTAAKNVFEVCRDRPRAFHFTDAGYFGSGSYFALEPSYAEQFCGEGHGPHEERAVILFAISISQAKMITLGNHYSNDRVRFDGFSEFYSGDRNTLIGLTRQHDAHFIPVKNYGCVHPVTGVKSNSVNYSYQAAPQKEATAHEIVIGSHHRCIPLAVVVVRGASVSTSTLNPTGGEFSRVGNL